MSWAYSLINLYITTSIISLRLYELSLLSHIYVSYYNYYYYYNELSLLSH